MSSGPSPKQIPEPVPDASGLQPSVEGPAGTIDYARKPRDRVSPSTGKPRRNWADHPVSIGLILTLALPTVFEQVLSALIGFTDTIVAGHTGATGDDRAASAAAVGAMTYLQWFAGLMTSTLSVGAMAIVARSIGARRPRLANRVAGTAVSAAFLIGVLTAVILFVCAAPLAWAFSLRGPAAQYAVDYLRIMCCTVCLQTAGTIGMACLRGAGDTVRPMVVTIAITLINGIASPALTFGWFGLPAMGVRGNALGTLLAFAAAGIVTFSFLFYGDGGLKLRLSHLKIVPHLLTRVARIGIPSWLEAMLLWGGQLAVVMLVMGAVDAALQHAGSGFTLAAHNATLRIESMAFLPGYGFGIAASTLVGQYLGAGKPEEARRAGMLSSHLAMVTMTLAAIPMILFPRFLLRMLVDSGDVVDLGWIPLIIAGLAQPAFAYAIVKSQALKGAGDTVSPLWTTLAGMGGRVIAILGIMWYLHATGRDAMGLLAVWVCIFLDLTFRGVILEIVFRRGKWQHKKV